MKKLFLIFMLSFFLLLGSGCQQGFNVTNTIKSIPVPIERDIQNGDITWLESHQSVSSITINFTVNVKIKVISIKVDFLSSDDKLIFSNTKSLTDLVKGQNYSIKFGIDFWDSLSVSKTSAHVVNGTVDLK